jgi:hypothetical protein
MKKSCRCIHCQHCIHVFEPLADGHSKIVGLFTICNKNKEFENKLATGAWYNGNRFSLLEKYEKNHFDKRQCKDFLHTPYPESYYCLLPLGFRLVKKFRALKFDEDLHKRKMKDRMLSDDNVMGIHI